MFEASRWTKIKRDKILPYEVEVIVAPNIEIIRDDIVSIIDKIESNDVASEFSKNIVNRLVSKINILKVKTREEIYNSFEDFKEEEDDNPFIDGKPNDRFFNVKVTYKLNYPDGHALVSLDPMDPELEFSEESE